MLTRIGRRLQMGFWLSQLEAEFLGDLKSQRDHEEIVAIQPDGHARKAHCDYADDLWSDETSPSPMPSYRRRRSPSRRRDLYKFGSSGMAEGTGGVEPVSSKQAETIDVIPFQPLEEEVVFVEPTQKDVDMETDPTDRPETVQTDAASSVDSLLDPWSTKISKPDELYAASWSMEKNKKKKWKKKRRSMDFESRSGLAAETPGPTEQPEEAETRTEPEQGDETVAAAAEEEDLIERLLKEWTTLNQNEYSSTFET